MRDQHQARRKPHGRQRGHRPVGPAAVGGVELTSDQHGAAQPHTCGHRGIQRLCGAVVVLGDRPADEVDGTDVRAAEGDAVQDLQRDQQRQRRIEPHHDPAQHRRGSAEHDQLDGTDAAHDRAGERQQRDLASPRRWPTASRPSRAGQPLRGPVQGAEGVEHGVRCLYGVQPPAGRPGTPASAAGPRHPTSCSRGGLVAALRRPSPIGRARPCAAITVMTPPATTSQMADAGPRRSTTQPPAKLAAMKLSEPHSRMRP